MAGNDTAALVVALSAQLTKFEKDMKGAVDIADKRTREIEGKFSALNTTINNKFSSLKTQATGNIGFLGDLLSSLGGKGTAAAVAIGLVAGAVAFLASQTADYAEKAKALKEGAETAGLTIAQFKLLGSAGKLVGLDFEQTSTFFTKFIASLGELRNGSGPLYDALLKVDTGLLRELSTTKDSAKAIDLLVAAFIRLDDQTKKLDLSKAAGGKGGLSAVRLLESLGKQGGLTGLEANSPAIDQAQIERAAQMRIEIDAIEKKTKNIWGGMFSDQILAAEKGMAITMQALAEAIERIVGAKERSLKLGGGLSGLKQSDFDARFTGESPTRLTVNKASSAGPDGSPGTGSPAVELAILQKNLALLGEAVTQGEQWKLKRLEIAAAAEKGGLMDGIAGRALAAFNLTMKAAALATRERLAVATEQQITEVKLAQLEQDRIKFRLTANEVEKATVVILREAKDAADALTVRRAYLPGLKQFEIDARNSRKALDEFAVSSLNTMADSITDAITKTKSLSDAFKDMANSIIRDLVRMAVKQTLLGPLAGLLGASAGAGGVSFLPGASLLSGNPTGLAEGGTIPPGGLAYVGEHGPNPRLIRAGGEPVTVTPNDVASSSRGVGDVHVTIAQSLDGANGDATIRQIAYEATARGVAQALARVPGMAVKAVSDHTSRY